MGLSKSAALVIMQLNIPCSAALSRRGAYYPHSLTQHSRPRLPSLQPLRPTVTTMELSISYFAYELSQWGVDLNALTLVGGRELIYVEQGLGGYSGRVSELWGATALGA